VSETEAPLPRATLLGLVAMGLAVLVLANDFTALTVALPAIEREYGADVTTAQWVINGYALVFGVLIVTGGRLADMFGRRRIFFVGTVIFAGFSLLGGMADSVGMLLASRALMGVGGAMMWPAILGMTYAMLPPERAGLAGGLILGTAGFGNAIGPLLGGFLTDAASWRWIFFLNLPIAAFAVFVTARVMSADKGTLADRRIDYGGILSLSIALVALLYALDAGIDVGWTSPTIQGLFAFAAISAAAFVQIERREGPAALVPGDVLRTRVFVACCLAVLMMSAVFFAALLYLPQFLSKVRHASAVGAGAGLLPMMGTFALTSFIAGPLYAKLGAKRIIAAGAAAIAAGMFLLSLLDEHTTFAGLIAGMVVLGVGIGLFYSSITTAAVTALDPSQASLAGGIVYMFQIAGGSIGLGFNTALVLTAPTFTDGIATAFRVDALFAACGLLIAVLFIGGDAEAATVPHGQHRAHAP
jgi:EmrB/QacA subfamily drug resistance transporter